MEGEKEDFLVYNSLTKQKEVFKPKVPGKVGMYVCGVTAYDFSHIGHARAYVAFDILYSYKLIEWEITRAVTDESTEPSVGVVGITTLRIPAASSAAYHTMVHFKTPKQSISAMWYLNHLGYEVVYVRNFTDVDDKVIDVTYRSSSRSLTLFDLEGSFMKPTYGSVVLPNLFPYLGVHRTSLATYIIKRANEHGVDPISLSAQFCQEFLDDMADLQCLSPTQQPRVSDHMEQIKDMISQIESNGCAYRVDGDVYFSVDASPNYGQLSGRKLEDNRSGERVAVDSRKRNPADFALWKAAKDGEPSWDSPWGPGRPGWHIECSAMSAQYLTPSFDIHGGGMDLIFPHHENEIAQSCSACPESNVSYWMHNGFVTTNDEKMAKSKGNFFTIRNVTELYHPLALRHFLLGTHYRSPVNYSISQIEIASEAVYRIYQTLQDCEDALSVFREGSAKEVAEPRGKTVRITDAAQECIRNLRNDVKKMSDDLHTFSILNSGLPEALKLMNSSLSLLKKKQQRQKQLSVIQSLIELEKEVRDALDILGLLSSLGYSEVLGQLKSKALKRSGFGDDYIESQIKERALARKNKDFSRGDKIRSDLAAKGIALMDVGTETVWRPCVPVQQEQPSGPEHAKPCVEAEKEQQAPLTTT